jgi:hypothetical protein
MLDQVSIRACHACSISRNSVDFCHARSSARLVLDQCAGFGGSIRLPVIDMIQKLVVTVLIPIAVGKAIASSSDAAKAGIKRASNPLTYLSHMLIIITPWIQISNTTLKGTFATVALFDIVAAVVAGGLLHAVSIEPFSLALRHSPPPFVPLPLPPSSLSLSLADLHPLLLTKSPHPTPYT